jgi:hypothetical protein
MARKAKTIVHVNQHKIRANLKKCVNEPVITVKHRGTNVYAHEVHVDGPCVLKYSPDNPLSCGARVWLETTAIVTVVR